MSGWYPMDRFTPGDGDSEEPAEPAGNADAPFPDEPHDDETCTGDEDCECPCPECRQATSALHRL